MPQLNFNATHLQIRHIHYKLAVPLLSKTPNRFTFISFQILINRGFNSVTVHLNLLIIFIHFKYKPYDEQQYFFE